MSSLYCILPDGSYEDGSLIGLGGLMHFLSRPSSWHMKNRVKWWPQMGRRCGTASDSFDSCLGFEFALCTESRKACIKAGFTVEVVLHINNHYITVFFNLMKILNLPHELLHMPSWALAKTFATTGQCCNANSCSLSLSKHCHGCLCGKTFVNHLNNYLPKNTCLT